MRGNLIGVYGNLKYTTDKQSEVYGDVDKVGVINLVNLAGARWQRSFWPLLAMLSGILDLSDVVKWYG